MIRVTLLSLTTGEATMVRMFPTMKKACAWIAEFGCTGYTIRIEEVTA